MRILLLSIFTIITVVFNTIPSFAESPAPKYALGIGLDVSSGTYGSRTISTYVTAPLIVDWFPNDRLDLELTIPLLYQRTSSTGRGGGGVLGGDYGLGDITLTSGYSLLRDSPATPHLRPTLYLKFPTAAESKEFSTGELDFGAGLAVSKWFGNWQPFTEVRYVVQGGSHAVSGAENFLTVDTGIAFSMNEHLMTSMYARFGSPPFNDMSAPLEVRLKTVWRFAERTYTEVYALRGLSNGSPDFGVGATVFFEF
ncbi:MAG: transporter [Desulfuromonadales bacterium]